MRLKKNRTESQGQEKNSKFSVNSKAQLLMSRCGRGDERQEGDLDTGFPS